MQARDQGSTQAVVFVLLFSSFDNATYYTKPSFVPELLCIFLYDGVAIASFTYWIKNMVATEVLWQGARLEYALRFEL